MKSMAAAVLLAAAVVWAPAPASARIRVAEVPKLVAKLESRVRPAYYGTATLVAITATEYFYVTNAHVLPSDVAAWRELVMYSYATDYQPVAFEVVGVRPGYDLAVLALPRSSMPGGGHERELQGLLQNAFLRDDVDGDRVRVGVVGYSGLMRERDEKRAKIVSSFLGDAPEHWGGSGLLSRKLRFKTVADCPVPFVDRCHWIPILTWGYSGSPVVVSKEILNDQRVDASIAGIVSHFSPLSDVTYVLPVDTVMAVAQRILDDARQLGRGVVEGRDLSEMFRFAAPQRIEVLRGPLAGSVLSGADPEQTAAQQQTLGTVVAQAAMASAGFDAIGGGGGLTPGGHDSMGGGHDSMGGGDPGFFADPDDVQLSTAGDVCFFGSFDYLRSLVALPQFWHLANVPMKQVVSLLPPLKGIRAVVEYFPGVRVRDGAGREQIFNHVGERGLATVAQFLRQYRATGANGLGYHDVSALLPQQLAVTGDDEIFGVLSRSRLNGVRVADAGGEAAVTQLLGLNGFDRATVAPIVAKAARNATDVVFSTTGATASTLISQGVLILQDNAMQLQAVDALGTFVIVDFPGFLRSETQGYFHYRGPVSLRLGGAGSPARQAFAVMTLQANAARGIYELKVITMADGVSGVGGGANGRAIELLAMYLPVAG